MPRDVRVYPEDILEALARIEHYMVGIDQAALRSNRLVLDAVLHNLQVVGEAAKRIPEELRQLQPGTEWRKIAGMRDLIAHAYFDLDPDIVWDVVANKLTPLRSAVQVLQGSL